MGRPDRVGDVAVALLAVAPLAVIPGGAVAFVLGKLLVVAAAVLVATWATPRGRLPRSLVRVAVAAAAWWLVVALTSAAPVTALLGRWPRYEGLVALPVYAGAAWAGARLLGPAADERRWRVWHASLTATAVVMAVGGLLEVAGWHPFGGAGMRTGSWQGNATELGLLGAVLLAVLGGGVRAGGRATRPGSRPSAGRGGAPAGVHRVWPWAGPVAAAVMVVLSGSRAAYVAVGVGAGVLLVAAWRARTAGGPERPAPRWSLVAGLVAVAAGVALVPASRDRLLAVATVEGRAMLWRETLDLLGARPLTGAGPSGFLDAIVPFHTREWAERVGMQDPPDSPHAWPLQAAVSGGLPLAALALAGVALALVAGVRGVRRADAVRRVVLLGHAAAVLGYGAGLLTHLTAAGTTPLVAAAAGACVARAPTPAPTRAATPAASTPPRARGESSATPPRWGRPTSWARRPRWAAPHVAWRVVAAASCLLLLPTAAAEWPMAAALRAMRHGDVATVERDLDAAHALRPWDADVDVQGTQVLAALASAGVPGAAERAVARGERATRELPDSMQAGVAFAVGLRLAGHPDAAAEVLDRLAARSPYDPAVLVQRGVLARGSGDLDRARDLLVRAAELDADNPVPWRQLEAVEEEAGDAAAAQRARERAEALSD